MSVEGTLRSAIDFAESAAYGITDELVKAGLAIQTGHELPSTCDELYHTDGTLADEATADFDLLTILNAFGGAIDLAEVMGVYVENSVAAGGSGLLVGAAAANAWDAYFGGAAHQLRIPPATGIILPCVAGLTVDATHKVLRLTHDHVVGADITYKLAIVGKAN